MKRRLLLTNNDPTPAMSQAFATEVSAALRDMSAALSDVLKELNGIIRKPADLQRVLKLDYNLSWQVFTVATLTDPLRDGKHLPGPASVDKFFKAARSHGASPETIKSARDIYTRVEELIQRYAVDRVSFKSMMSAFSEATEEEDSIDLQHRRAVARGVAHLTGVLKKTSLALMVIDQDEASQAFSGFALARTLQLCFFRPLERFAAFESATEATAALDPVRFAGFAPLKAGTGAAGLLLDRYSSPHLPDFKIRDHQNRLIVEIENPQVGIPHAVDLTFGVRFQNMPRTGEDLPTSTQIMITTAVELQLFDVLIRRTWSRDRTPRINCSTAGYNARGSLKVAHPITLEQLGQGPEALRTSDIPDYIPMINDAAQAANMNLADFEAYRIRVQYPLHRSVLEIAWV